MIKKLAYILCLILLAPYLSNAAPNVSNYTDQGGASTVIGGTLTISSGGTLTAASGSAISMSAVTINSLVAPTASITYAGISTLDIIGGVTSSVTISTGNVNIPIKFNGVIYYLKANDAE